MKFLLASRHAADREGGAFSFAHVLRRRRSGASSPFTSLRRTPHPPDPVTPSQVFGSKAKAYPAGDGGYPIPVSKGGGPGVARSGGHGRNRIPVVPGARTRQAINVFGAARANQLR